ncbi:amyloid beta A4 precursor protein-binding family A member 1-like, partial [Elysia marginata]
MMSMKEKSFKSVIESDDENESGACGNTPEPRRLSLAVPNPASGGVLDESVDNLSMEVHLGEDGSRHPSEISSISYQNLLDDAEPSNSIVSRRGSDDSLDSYPPDFPDTEVPLDELETFEAQDLPLSEHFPMGALQADTKVKSQSDKQSGSEKSPNLTQPHVRLKDCPSSITDKTGMRERTLPLDENHSSSADDKMEAKRSSLEIRNNIPVMGEAKDYEKDLTIGLSKMQGAKAKMVGVKQSPGLARRVDEVEDDVDAENKDVNFPGKSFSTLLSQPHRTKTKSNSKPKDKVVEVITPIPKNLNIENEYDYVKYARVQQGNSYVGMRLAYSSSNDSLNIKQTAGSDCSSRELSPEKNLQQKIPETQEPVREDTLTEIPLNNSDYLEDKKAFTLSPENTECDSVEVDSVTSEGENSTPGFPTVEDGLSSSQASDAEDGAVGNSRVDRSPSKMLQAKQKATLEQDLFQDDECNEQLSMKPKEMDAQAIMDDLKMKREALDMAIADIKSAIQRSKSMSLESPYPNQQDVEEPQPVWVKRENRESMNQQLQYRQEEMRRVREEIEKQQETLPYQGKSHQEKEAAEHVQSPQQAVHGKLTEDLSVMASGDIYLENEITAIHSVRNPDHLSQEAVGILKIKTQDMLHDEMTSVVALHLEEGANGGDTGKGLKGVSNTYLEDTEKPTPVECKDGLSESLDDVESDNTINNEEDVDLDFAANSHEYNTKIEPDDKSTLNYFTNDKDHKGSHLVSHVVQEAEETDCKVHKSNSEEQVDSTESQEEKGARPYDGKGLVGTIQPDGPPRGYDSDDECEDAEGIRYTRRNKGKKYALLQKDDSLEIGGAHGGGKDATRTNGHMFSNNRTSHLGSNGAVANRMQSFQSNEPSGEHHIHCPDGALSSEESSDIDAHVNSYNRAPNADSDTDEETDRLLQKQYQERDKRVEIPELTDQAAESRKCMTERSQSKAKEAAIRDPDRPEVLIEGVLFRARYLGSTQLISEGQPSKAMRMMQAQEAVGRIKAPEGENQPSTDVDLFVSTEKIMVLNTDLQEIMMDHSLRTISYIADIGDILVIMARRRLITSPDDMLGRRRRQAKILCHVFESDEAQLIAQSIGQAFQVAYLEFLKANGIEDPGLLKEMDYQDVLNQQEIYGEELNLFANKDFHKEVIVPKSKNEPLGVVIVESGWGSMVPTVVLANMLPTGPAARCGQLNIGDQIISINGVSLVGLPLSACQTYIK